MQLEVSHRNAVQTLNFVLADLHDGVSIALTDAPKPGTALYRLGDRQRQRQVRFRSRGGANCLIATAR